MNFDDDIRILVLCFLVVPCSIEELQPLMDHLMSDKPGPGEDNQSIVFSRGAIMTGGRLDLCKQVVGPQGIQPLLNAMKCSSVVNRLLLGMFLKNELFAISIFEFSRK